MKRLILSKRGKEFLHVWQKTAIMGFSCWQLAQTLELIESKICLLVIRANPCFARGYRLLSRACP